VEGIDDSFSIIFALLILHDTFVDYPLIIPFNLCRLELRLVMAQGNTKD